MEAEKACSEETGDEEDEFQKQSCKPKTGFTRGNTANEPSFVFDLLVCFWVAMGFVYFLINQKWIIRAWGRMPIIFSSFLELWKF